MKSNKIICTGLFIWLLLVAIAVVIDSANVGLDVGAFFIAFLTWVGTILGAIVVCLLVGHLLLFFLYKLYDKAKKDLHKELTDLINSYDKAYEKAMNKPHEWLAPILGVAAGFFTELCKELFTENAIWRIIIGSFTALIFIGGSFLWHKSRPGAIAMFSLPLFLVIVKILYNSVISESPSTSAEITTSHWLGFALLFITAIAMAYLAETTKVKEE